MTKKGRARGATVSPADLEVCQDNGEFVLTFEDKPILTDEGHVVAHKDGRLPEHIISEFESEGRITIKDQKIVKPKKFGSYALYSIQKTYVESGEDNLTKDFPGSLLEDPILYRSAGPEQTEQMARYGPVLDFLAERKLFLPALVYTYSYEEAEDEGRQELTSLPEDFTSAVRHEFMSLPNHRKTVTVFLRNIHLNVLLLPLMLATGRCSANEYATGVMAATVTHSAIFGSKVKEHREMFVGLLEDAMTALDYISFYEHSPLLEKVRGLIAAKEGKTREFKSTFRWSIKAQRNDEAVTHSCLKTIAAFLNTDGGTLLIGVADNGDIIGIEADNFSNSDKFLLHLMDVTRRALGQHAPTFFNAEVCEVDGKTVCIVECSKSPEPVFVNSKDTDEFFVRMGPSTVKLPPREHHVYIREHFTRK